MAFNSVKEVVKAHYPAADDHRIQIIIGEIADTFKKIIRNDNLNLEFDIVADPTDEEQIRDAIINEDIFNDPEKLIVLYEWYFTDGILVRQKDTGKLFAVDMYT